MTYLASAMIVIGAVCLLNLLFTFGVIRRLRLHEQRLSEAERQAPERSQTLPVLPAGSPVGEFAAVTTGGTRLNRGWLEGGEALVGFFSVDCPSCATALPGFQDHASTHPGGRERTLAIVMASEKEQAAAETMAASLEPAAQVVVEPKDGPVPAAFGVSGSPMFLLVDDHGVVRASSYRLADLTAADPAAAEVALG